MAILWRLRANISKKSKILPYRPRYCHLDSVSATREPRFSEFCENNLTWLLVMGRLYVTVALQVGLIAQARIPSVSLTPVC